MKEQYFVVRGYETRIEAVTKEELERRLGKDANGDSYYGTFTSEGENCLITALPDGECHSFYDRDGTIIIKGVVINPRPVEVVTKIEVD